MLHVYMLLRLGSPPTKINKPLNHLSHINKVNLWIMFELHYQRIDHLCLN